VTASDDDRAWHARVDPHRRGAALRDVVLGGQDGLVNVLGVVLGVAGATHDARIVLAAGFAAAIAESLSMGAVAYTSTRAERAHYDAELARERRHIARVPSIELDDLREICRRKGVDAARLDGAVRAIAAYPELWLALMMAEEHGLAPAPRGRALRAALVVGLAAIVGSLVPLAPFALLSVGAAMWTSLAVATVTLFALGAYKSLLTIGAWWLGGLEVAAIGIVSALGGYAAGRVFHVASS
jgi:vacuolar iron transporter family protein